MIEQRRFRRKVEPFEDIEVDVDLQCMLTSGPGMSPAHYDDVWPLADWIEDDWVRLRALSLHHLVPVGHHKFFYDKWGPRLSGSPSHQSLCALAAVYLHAIGKKFLVGGASSCSYSGGWADVAATDGSIYVECGTLNTRKPIHAMLAGDTLMVLPYLLGCDTPNEQLIARLDPFPECVEEDIQTAQRFQLNCDKSVSLGRIGRICLGYVFEPKCKLKPNPFGSPLGLRPSRGNREEP